MIFRTWFKIFPGRLMFLLAESSGSEGRASLAPALAGSNDVEGARNVAARQHPIGRLGVAEDIALGIVFLASDDAGFMTGSGMVVDGGLTRAEEPTSKRQSR